MFRACAATVFFLLTGLLLFVQFSGYGQPGSYHSTIRVPIYKSKQDSARLAEIDRQIADLRTTTPGNAKKLDSLYFLYQKNHAEVITGYRNISRPARDHISLDSLLRMTNLDSVTRVSIHNYGFKEIPSVILKCKNLESLELIRTGIRRLPETLNALSKLRTVRIYNPATRGKIKLKENRHVTALVIRSDDPSCLPRSYRAFKALERLDLSDNSLRRFPNGARHNKQLRELNLQHNELTLKRRLKRHRYLKTLALQHNSIRRVPNAIRRFDNLRKLNFNYNQITDVHPGIRLLEKLENISFYHNELRAIPDGVYELTGLREIDLFYNKIETVEPRIALWKNVKRLYLSHNQIFALPENIGSMLSLEGLYVWDNHLESLPASIGQMQSLRFLWVNGNSLKDLPDSFFDLEKIEELDVSHNFLASISESVFDFKYLKILSLVDNPWNDETLVFIHNRVSKLRARGVFVHVPDK